jgi:hypothetical protein
MLLKKINGKSNVGYAQEGKGNIFKRIFLRCMQFNITSNFTGDGIGVVR